MRLRTTGLLALVLSLAPSGWANDIEPGKEFYTASPAPRPIVLDGNLDEWAGVPVLADPKFSIPKGSGDAGTLVLFEEYQGGTWTGPDDHTSAVQVVYDVDNVYFGFVVTDEYHENSANSAWNGDSVQLMIANAARNAQVALYNYALGGVEDALGEVIVMHEAGPGGTEAVVTRNGTTKRTVYEIKLPIASLGLTSLEPGTQFGLGMAINDGDELTPGQRGWGGLGAHSIVFGKTPQETALVTLGARDATIEILGTGTESLLGGDLTDPENDGDEAAGPTSPTWNWRAITANIEPGFEGGEFSFNIFDNRLGPGNDKWCCDDPSDANPYWVSVEFNNPVSLTHFTISSANDVPDRDPLRFEIQGSNDGQNFTTIYRRDSETPIWNARLQVAKITLPLPAPAYRHIRYIVFHTAGTLHQVGEIEYFGIYGGGDQIFLSAINPALDAFTFRANDAGASVVDPPSGKLTIDGQVVSLTVSDGPSATDYSYRPPSPFPPGSQHTYRIEVKDTLGNTVISDGEFTTQNYALLGAAEKVTADTASPGFIWRVHQNASFTATDNTRPLLQLAGLLGQNFADPTLSSIAVGPGTPGANNTLPIEFQIPTTINLDQEAGFSGDIQPDDAMPGIPGSSGSGNDGIAADIITYLELPAGRHTLIVNSDDGFRTTAGNIHDIFQAQLVGEFNGGRGASDTVLTVFALEAGVYPFRTVWQEGGGGANIEWKRLMPDNTEVLLNDTASGGFRAYRRATTATPTGINLVVPLPGATGVALNSQLYALIVEGANAVDLASVKLSLNGTEVAATATRTGNRVTISYQPPSVFASGSQNTAGITYTAGGTTRTETWTFTVETYPTLTRAHHAVSVDVAQPGFVWRVFQNEAVTHTSLAQTELALAGQLLLDGQPLPNLADPQAVGIAAGPGVVSGPLIRFDIPTVINLSQSEGEANGNFTPDDQMPGIPGTNFSTDGIDAEIITFVEFPAGIITMGVNSDDGFRTEAGYINVPGDGVRLGQFDGGRGAADTQFKFLVQDAGRIGLRTIWQEGGGGANIEWFTVKADGSRVLLNDTANGGLRAYRTGVAPNRPTEFSIGISVSGTGQVQITWTAAGTTLQQSTNLQTWTDVANATSPYTPNVGAATQTFYRLRM